MDVSGISVAGVETCIEVPSLGVLFDLGRCTRTAVSAPVVFLSHGHLDHIGAIAQHAARRAMMKMGESTYVVPAAIYSDVERLFSAAGALDGNPIPRRVVALGLDDEFDLGKGRRVRPFRTFHRVPSQGYSVWERRHHLRDEFRELPGARLAELRRQGVQIEAEHEVALLSFTGDTRIEAVEQNAALQQTETLVMECTFVDERVSVSDARTMGHTHLDEILACRELLRSGKVVLSHFSARYTPAEIERALAERVPEEWRPRISLLPRHPAR
ncbi:MAG TPA: MBL fold metallo-hydrolase [Polyangiaceae bacterium]|nr:MBL fold metallo-hydrolase [Polyangiaceae bacterium]